MISCSETCSAYKHVLIPSYVIRVIYQKQNITKLNINWLVGEQTDQDQQLQLSIQSYILFWKVSFGKEQSKPPGKYL